MPKGETIKRTTMYTSGNTRNQLKLLALVSGLSVSEIIRKFAKACQNNAIKHQEGCSLEFGSAQDIVIIKFLPKNGD